MDLPDERRPASLPLSSRRQAHREEILRIVREGAEHPTCELVREMPLQTPEQKVDFVKLLQGVGNALIAEERSIVVGADQAGKKFVAVANVSDFDPARISQLLSKYLDTLPFFESFIFEADTGEPFVVIVIGPKQSKPIVAKTDVQASDGRFLLRKGDIWIKENTGLRRALRPDLDAMYEEESEARARRWFDRLSVQLMSSHRLGTSLGIPIPQADLIYGDVQAFRLYVQILIAGSHQRHFRMLLDLLRDVAIDGWSKVGAYSQQWIEKPTEFRVRVGEHEKDYFLPAAKALVELGLLLIKHCADPAWLHLVVGLLAEIFDASERLARLGEIEVIDPGAPMNVGRYLPALEAVLGIRVLGLYALRREQFDALSFILKRYVRSLVPPRRSQHPFVFWPFPGRIKMPEGLILFCWQYRVEGSWTEYFGSQDEYLRTAAQFEFLLEFNSWLGTSPEGAAWLAEYKKDTDFAYYADIGKADFNSVVGLAERIYEAFRRGPNDALIVNITVEKILVDVRAKLTLNDVPLLFVAFLDYFVISQAKAAMRMGRFPYTVVWGEKVGPALKGYRGSKEKGTLPAKLSFLPQSY